MTCICNPHAELGMTERLPNCPVHGINTILEDAQRDVKPLIKRETAADCRCSCNPWCGCSCHVRFISNFKEAVAWAYQFASIHGASVAMLDNLSAVAQGELAPHEWEVVEPRVSGEGMSEQERRIRAGFCFDSERDWDVAKYLIGIIDTLRRDRKLLRESAETTHRRDEILTLEAIAARQEVEIRRLTSAICEGVEERDKAESEFREVSAQSERNRQKVIAAQQQTELIVQEKDATIEAMEKQIFDLLADEQAEAIAAYHKATQGESAPALPTPPTTKLSPGVWNVTALDELLISLEDRVKSSMEEPGCAEVLGFWWHRLRECRIVAAKTGVDHA